MKGRCMALPETDIKLACPMGRADCEGGYCGCGKRGVHVRFVDKCDELSRVRVSCGWCRKCLMKGGYHVID